MHPFWLVHDSSLLNIMNFTVSNFRNWIFYQCKASIMLFPTDQCFSSSQMSWINLPLIEGFWICCCVCINIKPCLEIVGLSTFYAHFAVGRALSQGYPILHYLQLSTNFCFLCLSMSCLYVCCLIKSVSLASFMLSNDSSCALWVSIFWAHNSTHLAVL